MKHNYSLTKIITLILFAFAIVGNTFAADDEATAALEEKIKIGLTEFFDAFENEDTKKDAQFTKLIAENFIRTENGKVITSNREDYRNWATVWLQVKTKDLDVNNNRAYFYWTSDNTIDNPSGNSTDKKIRIINNGFSVWIFDESGMAIREDTFYDELNLMKQLGHTLQPPK